MCVNLPSRVGDGCTPSCTCARVLPVLRVRHTLQHSRVASKERVPTDSGLENVLCPIAPLGLSMPAMVTALFWHTVVAAAVSVAFGWTPVLHSDAGPPQFVVVVSLARGASTMVVRTIRALLYAGLAVECSRSQELTELISVAYLLARRLSHCLEVSAPVMAKLLRLPPPLPPTPPPLPPPPRHTAGTINTKATAPRHSTTTPPGRSDRFPPVLDVVQRAVRPRSFPDRCV